MKKQHYFLLLFLMLCQFIGSQNLKNANNLFATKAYVDAAQLFLNEKNKTQEVLEKLGDCYYFNSNMKEATKWYHQLVTTYKSTTNKIYFFRYYQALKGIENYNDADIWQQHYLSFADKNNIPTINTMQFIDSLKKHSDHTFKISNASFNTEYSDFGAVYHNSAIVFSSNRTEGKKYDWNNLPYLDLYQINKNESDIPTSFSTIVNSSLHESNAIFTNDGKTMYFTKNNITNRKKLTDSNHISHLKIYKSSFINGEWTLAIELPFNGDTYSCEHPALSTDEKQLYFSSDMPGTIGSFDIFVVDIIDNNTFGTPKNIGTIVNTEHREQFPFVKGTELYFASDGHFGIGGLDIFKSNILKDSFSKPQNLGLPINSSSDDFAYFMNNDKTSGFISSNRPGGKGDDDIYTIEKIHTYFVHGVVQNKKDLSLLPKAIVTLFDENNSLIGEIKVGEDASYSFPIELNKSYILKANLELFNPSKVEFHSDNNGNINKNILLQLDSYEAIEEQIVVENGKTQIKINPIYFDFDKWHIRPDAAKELENVVSILKKYPEMKIEIGAHTDSRGLDDYNLNLSHKRAQSVKDYLIHREISTENLTFKGYGETQLLNKCSNGIPCKMKEHDINRRCEFVLTN